MFSTCCSVWYWGRKNNDTNIFSKRLLVLSYLKPFKDSLSTYWIQSKHLNKTYKSLIICLQTTSQVSSLATPSFDTWNGCSLDINDHDFSSLSALWHEVSFVWNSLPVHAYLADSSICPSKPKRSLTYFVKPSLILPAIFTLYIYMHIHICIYI